ncbi:hypothetical protein R1sor_009531 [Riccia sorocarpa]|uniref:Uncharacterized protein n=1 Tax=Riccia sorocarpa TaxID=122646 RepID=A0ABD3HYW0_9MARC
MRSVADSPAMQHVEGTFQTMHNNPRAPVVDELKLLWEGVRAYDARVTCPEEERNFTLNGICMWTLHDIPGYGVVSGLQVSGTRGCPTCGEHLESKTSEHLKTTIYMGHRKYLPDNSPLRQGCRTQKPPVTHFTNWYAMEYEIQAGVRERKKSGLNRIPVLVELPYYDSLLIQNLGDPMHQEGEHGEKPSDDIFLVIWMRCGTERRVRSSMCMRMHGFITGQTGRRVKDLLHGSSPGLREILSVKDYPRSETPRVTTHTLQVHSNMRTTRHGGKD